ncbi:MAG: hypothetical protein AB7V50_06890, partial [Vampirovibrionia bacterium]
IIIERRYKKITPLNRQKMLTTRINKHFSSKHIQKQVSFSGDKNLLKPYFDIGMNNKAKLVEDEFYIQRKGINEEYLLDFLKDPDDNKPFLITGKSTSGKSVLAKRLSYKLKKEGHKVFCIDNYLDNIALLLTHEKLDELIKEIGRLKTKERVFIFIDEPQFIVEKEIDNDPSLKQNIKKSTIYKLAKFVENNPNIKLVGSMYDGGLNHTYYPETTQYCDLLRDLFPVENQFDLPLLLDNSFEENITMLNKVLNLAGFNSMPQKIKEQLKQTGMNANIRQLVFSVFRAITKEKNRVDDVNTKEDIKKPVWKALIRDIETYKKLNKDLFSFH